MGSCLHSGVKIQLNKIDILKKEHQTPKYLAINPTGHIPMIEEGQYKVMGGNHIIYVYICKNN